MCAEPPVHQVVLDAVEKSTGLLQHELGLLGRARTAVGLSGSSRERFPRLILGRVLRRGAALAGDGRADRDLPRRRRRNRGGGGDRTGLWWTGSSP